MVNRPIDNARKVLNKLRKGEIKTVRNPEKYEDVLPEEEFGEMLYLLDYDLKYKPQKNDNSESITLEELYDLIDNDDKKAKDNSKETDKKNIKGVFSVLNIDNLFDIVEYDVYNLLKEKYRGGLPRVLGSLLKVLKLVDLDEIFGDLSKSLEKNFKELRHETEAENIRKRLEDKTDYDEEYTKLVDPSKESNMKGDELLMYLLHTQAIYDENGELTVIPRGYFRNTKIGIGSEDENYYDPETGTIAFNDFKTSGNFKYKYKIKPELNKKIKELTQGRKYMFENTNGAMYSNVSYSNYFNKYLGTNINNYRKILENYFLKNDIYSTLKLSNAMGHSPSAQKMEYVAHESY